MSIEKSREAKREGEGQRFAGHVHVDMSSGRYIYIFTW